VPRLISCPSIWLFLTANDGSALKARSTRPRCVRAPATAPRPPRHCNVHRRRTHRLVAGAPGPAIPAREPRTPATRPRQIHGAASRATRRRDAAPLPRPAQRPSLVRRQCLRFMLYLHARGLPRVRGGRAHGVVGRECAPDLVVRAEADPLRDGPVLLLLLGERELGLEAFVRRHPAGARGAREVSVRPPRLSGRCKAASQTGRDQPRSVSARSPPAL